MPPLARAFSENLRKLVVPALTEAGFAFDGSRTFRRLPSGSPCVQIINFQLGQRFMEGRFTVNLAVYNPEDATAQMQPKLACEHHCSARLRQRLGVLIPGRLGRLCPASRSRLSLSSKRQVVAGRQPQNHREGQRRGLLVRPRMVGVEHSTEFLEMNFIVHEGFGRL
jgi:uncharacterized protein DUF4304